MVWGINNSDRSVLRYKTTWIQVDRARNSASIVDMATVICFLLTQEIKDCPRNTKKPDVDFLSEMSLPQSASQYAVSSRLLPLRESFRCWVPFKYLKIFLSEVQLAVVCVAILEQTLEVASAMSGLVAVMA